MSQTAYWLLSYWGGSTAHIIVNYSEYAIAWWSESKDIVNIQCYRRLHMPFQCQFLTINVHSVTPRVVHKDIIGDKLMADYSSSILEFQVWNIQGSYSNSKYSFASWTWKLCHPIFTHLLVWCVICHTDDRGLTRRCNHFGLSTLLMEHCQTWRHSRLRIPTSKVNGVQRDSSEQITNGANS